jgi:mxaD protein
MRLRRSFLSALAIVGMTAVAAHAHGPTPHKVEEKIDIAAPPAKVWEIVKNFADIGNWHPLVAKSEGTGGNGSGAERHVTLKSGGELLDGLDDYSDGEMHYSYRLSKENVDAFPVSFYSAELDVKPGTDGGTEVDWIGRFYRADTGNFPPEGKDDKAAIAAMENFIKEGLKGLKAKAEGK